MDLMGWVNIRPLVCGTPSARSADAREARFSIEFIYIYGLFLGSGLGTWIKGDGGQTCKEVCGAVGKICNSEMQSSITSRSKMQAALVAAGYASGCSSYKGGRSYAGAPFISRGVCYSFAPNKGGYAPANEAKYDNSVCDTNPFPRHSPLCYCIKGKFHLSTRI